MFEVHIAELLDGSASSTGNASLKRARTFERYMRRSCTFSVTIGQMWPLCVIVGNVTNPM